MNFFHAIGDTVSGAVKSVADKNRRTAAVNRLKLVIKTEEDNANEAYIALGKYYYSRLRSEFNNDTEPFCVIVDNANQRIEKAVAGIEKLNGQEISAPNQEIPAPSAELPETPPEQPTDSSPGEDPLAARQEWNEWVHTVHMETAQQGNGPSEENGASPDLSQTT